MASYAGDTYGKSGDSKNDYVGQVMNDYGIGREEAESMALGLMMRRPYENPVGMPASHGMMMGGPMNFTSFPQYGNQMAGPRMPSIYGGQSQQGGGLTGMLPELMAAYGDHSLKATVDVYAPGSEEPTASLEIKYTPKSGESSDSSAN
ncbi:hypothetical protein HN419_04815 [Candidatus Woesearchaeota archaeon]|jgi:hypothetical protein|nr:hypothetical protein [Candidatus Woesearchaeota archaeon]MBT3537802.1 hypothetical protein [Candidatus Woesearchaeota archaeon]MBT4697933.1 hypothetical protein [Candidatus Woesearchaeota archaeon]MBT4717294.1 hypothetical protein [Candidatus Woesearchaeota archaeon]MBT7105471.1 hypothetical protein [Candidatus Woesearchaeota archaeon]